MSERRFFVVRLEKLKAVALDSFRCAHCQQWVYADAYQYHQQHRCGVAVGQTRDSEMDMDMETAEEFQPSLRRARS